MNSAMHGANTIVINFRAFIISYIPFISTYIPRIFSSFNNLNIQETVWERSAHTKTGEEWERQW